MSWRPEEWEMIISGLIIQAFTEPSKTSYLNGFEAGATAMLEALRKQSILSVTSNNFKIDVASVSENPTDYLQRTIYVNEKVGVLVFIPDDKENK